MAFRIRLAVAGALVAVVAVALGGTGLGSATIARIAGHGASAAVRPTYMDMSDRFRSDPGWGTAQGLVAPDPVAASAAVATPVRAAAPAWSGNVPLTPGPAMASRSTNSRSPAVMVLMVTRRANDSRIAEPSGSRRTALT